MEHEIGQLLPGMEADVLVLSEDLKLMHVF